MLISKITMMLRFQCLWFGVAILSSFDALSPRLCHQNRKIIRQSLQLYTVHSLLNIKYILHIITKSFSLTWPNVCRWWNQLVPFRKGHSCSHAKIWSFFNDRTTNRFSVESWKSLNSRRICLSIVFKILYINFGSYEIWISIGNIY